MKVAEQLALRFKEVFIDGKWIAFTNWRDQLEQVSWEEAITQVHDLNTIAALTFHLDYYLGGVLQVLKGGPLEIRDMYSYDMPPITSEEGWQQLKNRFYTNTDSFYTELRSFTEEKLASVFVKEEYGNYLRSVDGMIEHAYYHLGQVVLIRKLLDPIEN